MSFILTSIIMFAFWVVLSGEFTFILLLSGGVFSLLTAFMTHDIFIGNVKYKVEIPRVLRFFKFLPWLLWQIAVSNIDVAYRVLHPKMPINPQIVHFKPELETDMGVVTLSNAITLTPGTVTIKAGKDEFIVHAISDPAAQSMVEGGDMKTRVKKIEGESCV